jgi:hypothetical protein
VKAPTYKVGPASPQGGPNKVTAAGDDPVDEVVTARSKADGDFRTDLRRTWFGHTFDVLPHAATDEVNTSPGPNPRPATSWPPP